MKCTRWLRLAVAAFVLLFAGVVYAWSILKAPLGQAFGWGQTTLALNYTITMGFFALGGLSAGLLSSRIPAPFRLFVPGILVALGFWGVSAMTGESPLPLFLLYGVLTGFSLGVIHTTCITTAVAWFPDRAGLSSGIVMMAFGFSTLLLGKVIQTLFDLSSFGWRKTFLSLGIALMAVTILASFFIRLPESGEVPPRAIAKTSAGEDFSTKRMLSRLSFYKIFVFFTLYAAVGSTMISFAKDYALSLHVTGDTAVTLVGLLSVFNGIGRLVSGFILDRFGLRKTQFVTSTVILTATLFGLLGALTSALFFGVAGLCLVGFAHGFSPTVSANFILTYFGAKYYAPNLSVANMTLLPASLTATLAGRLVDVTGSYVPVMALLLGFSLVGALLNYSIKKP